MKFIRTHSGRVIEVFPPELPEGSSSDDDENPPEKDESVHESFALQSATTRLEPQAHDQITQ